MAEVQRTAAQHGKFDLRLRDSAGRALTGTIAIGFGIAIVVGAGGYVVWPMLQGQQTRSSSASTAQTEPAVSRSSPAPQPNVPLTQASIDLLLNDLEQAVKRKDVDGVLRHMAPDAVVLIRMKQGKQQQTAMLTREEYRKALASEFAFPSANDFTHVNTTVSIAADEQTAKVSFKTTETLLQANRELKIEGDETLVVAMRGDKPVIISLEKGVPGDST
ncbi:MAG: hypothetical protein OEY63_04275 [Gemmatimonadota bacterium]|nr:hypothetical protein [Gemmatimonadota bacterium]